jgi:DNA-binding response OmpR family regulator
MITILCVEDEADIRKLIVEELNEAGFATLEAANGQEALETTLSKWPDIVITDISMPIMDGHQLLAEVQVNHPQHSVYLADGPHRSGNMLSGLRAGAADYLTKPIDFDLLLAKVTGCVTRIENDKAAGRAF